MYTWKMSPTLRMSSPGCVNIFVLVPLEDSQTRLCISPLSFSFAYARERIRTRTHPRTHTHMHRA